MPDNRLEERIQGWRSRLAIFVSGLLAYLLLSGLAILLAPFSLATQVNVYLHTAAGIAFLVPFAWYLIRHLVQYWRSPLSHNVVLGYVGALAVVVCCISGIVLTVQAVMGPRISYAWDLTHNIATFAILAFAVPHLIVIAVRDRRARAAAEDPAAIPAAEAHHGRQTAVILGLSVLATVAFALVYRPIAFQKAFPDDYSYRYGEDRPFAPSLARTADLKPLDERLLAGSLSCGTSGCHEQIVKEWEPSAHRYAAMDAAFQKIQMDMAQQNGPESTRYCGGCHDPISLFAGTKNLFVDHEKLSSLRGYQEGVSCLACHAVRQVDVKGNANYMISAPRRYMFEVEYDESPNETRRFLRDFLIRAYPRQHVNDLSKRMFKTPEYCAACHKQFIDQEINSVGWVQLQNQYDNWRQSRWNHPNEAGKTIECRECHMPLVDSRDPASGDAQDYNRTARDGKHRSHRFIGANQMMPALLKLPGYEEHIRLTQQWLKGEFEIREIAHKWRTGRVVDIKLVAPGKAPPGEEIAVRVVLTSNKVGHDFPTGPLDIIQSWLDVKVTDDRGALVYSMGSVDSKGFIEPGTFMFKAEPVDQYGNLIDRHNLWEMVGVRYRRALFPGFSDTTEFRVTPPRGAQRLHVKVTLRYRKADQYLINFMFGEQSGLTSPVTELASGEAVIAIAPRAAAAAAATARGSL